MADENFFFAVDAVLLALDEFPPEQKKRRAVISILDGAQVGRRGLEDLLVWGILYYEGGDIGYSW
jgi:hypothetical protein